MDFVLSTISVTITPQIENSEYMLHCLYTSGKSIYRRLSFRMRLLIYLAGNLFCIEHKCGSFFVFKSCIYTTTLEEGIS